MNNIEDLLKDLKNEYQNTKMPNYLIYEGWQTLKLHLSDGKSGVFSAYFQKALIFAAVLIVVLETTAKVSQAAKPGDKLYPLKLATENITSLVTGNQATKVENRAQEIIDLSKNNDKNLDEALKRYTNTLETSKNNTKDKNKQELKDTLENQEERLREVEGASEHNKKLIEEAADKTHKTQGEIKGERIDNKNEDDEEEQNFNQREPGRNEDSNHSSEQ